jgi:hypothetical protein
MFATHLSCAAGGWQICGCNLPEWGLKDSFEEMQDVKTALKTGRNHIIDVEALISKVNNEGIEYIQVDSYAMRIEYFVNKTDEFRRLFTPPNDVLVNDDELAIHIRTGNILNGLHPDYAPLPLTFYHRLVFETALKPVFIGQIEDNWYGIALKDQFPNARFLSGSPLHDFQTLRSAKNIVTAISSFSWLAAFLSNRAEIIHLPAAGILNPAQRPDIDLLPYSDNRYQFYSFPVCKYSGTDIQKSFLASRPAWAAPQNSYFFGYAKSKELPHVLNVNSVKKLISNAVRNRKPFSFLRLGDGEGALLTLGESSTLSLDIKYLQGHFGAQADLATMQAIKGELNQALLGADLIGIRDDVWLADEKNNGLDESMPDFFLQFMSVFPQRNLARKMIDEHAARRVWRLFNWAQKEYPNNIPACSQWINYDLATLGFWKDLVRSLPRINIIHCSPNLPDKLTKLWGIPVRSFLVPDKASQQIQWTDLNIMHPPHYPDVFSHVREDISNKCEGEVFFVGAGLAGKGYMRTIKENNGIALDLGALLDAWDDRATRPQIYSHKTSNNWITGDPVPIPFTLRG